MARTGIYNKNLSPFPLPPPFTGAVGGLKTAVVAQTLSVVKGILGGDEGLISSGLLLSELAATAEVTSHNGTGSVGLTLADAAPLGAAGVAAVGTSTQAAREDHVHENNLIFLAPTALTIAAGVVTVSDPEHTLAGQGGAADDLDTISGLAVGQAVMLRPVSDTVNITIKHATGNIECPGGVDIVLAEDDDFVLCVMAATKVVVLAYKTKAKAYVHTSDLQIIAATPGAEAANAIDIVGALTDLNGVAISAAQQVFIRSMAVTANEGDLAAASTPVGTVKKAVNPATGANELWMETTAAGLFSFKVSNTVAEETVVVIEAEGCRSKVLKLTFT